MNKYLPFYKYFIELKEDEITISFKGIEKILLFDLPPSAFKFRAWWGNDAYHTHARSWLDAGWVTKKIDLGQSIYFKKVLEVKELPLISKPQTFTVGEKSNYSNLFFDLKLDFVTDMGRHQQLIESYNNLQKSFENDLWENVIYNGWKIIESILFYIIELNKSKSEKLIQRDYHDIGIEKLSCWQLIEIATALNYLSYDSSQAARFLKNYRNVIHPEYQLKNNIKIDETTAVMFVCLLKKIVNGIKSRIN